MMERKQETQKTYYDKSAKDLEPLGSGEHVRLRTAGPKPHWEPAVILQTPQPESPRSYLVKSETGGVYQRNRRDILKTRETHNFIPQYDSDDDQPEDHVPDCDISLDTQSAKTSETHGTADDTPTVTPVKTPCPTGSYRTKAGREIRPRCILDL